jgi:very-short-patch-repair endonuclease
VVDFFCPDARLIVEVDGGHHGEHNARDAARTAWLQRHGYRVIRFWNSDVLARTDDVLATILAALNGTE